MTKMVQSKKHSQLHHAKGNNTTWQAIRENIWTIILGTILVAVISYSVYIQILHHP